MTPAYLIDHMAAALRSALAREGAYLELAEDCLQQYDKLSADYEAHVCYAAENGLDPLDWFEFMGEWECGEHREDAE